MRVRGSALGLVLAVAAPGVALGIAGMAAAGDPQAPSGLPSGRSESYRTLEEYEREMRDMAEGNPDLVRPLAFPHTTFEGRTVRGVEITTDPQNIRDGKPVFLLAGLHHPREWPSGEHAIEWAYDLLQGYRGGDPELRALVERTRTIIVPVVNPDGFEASRSAGERNGFGSGRSRGADYPDDYDGEEDRRKNCRVPGVRSGSCPDGGGSWFVGVDVNRNYGGLWGGPGAHGTRSADTYRGRAPFSEPESRNIRDLVASRAVVTLISTHTAGDVVLRPFGSGVGRAPDDALYKRVGSEMAAENGFKSIETSRFAAASGITEDWTYPVTGGLGFTFEIGSDHHPPFRQVVGRYTGASGPARRVDGGGNRGAFLAAQRSTATVRRHAVLRGTATPGASLVATRKARMPTWAGYERNARARGPRFLTERLTIAMDVPPSGVFDFHLNPSVSPVALMRKRWRRGNERAWTLRCSVGGELRYETEIVLRRGTAKTLDLAERC